MQKAPQPTDMGNIEASGAMMPISDAEFNALRTLIYNRFGINLTDQKKSLLVGRLQKLLRQQGFTNFQSYYDFLVKEPGEKGLSDLINLVSTNYTYFNREKDHFDYFLQTALPTVISRLKQENRRDLRVWCAGCSTGEEAYTLLMLMHECLGQEYKHWDAGILATDISERVLETAATGVYPEDRIASLPEAWRRKYFRKVSGNQWGVVDALKKEATFRRFNLMNTQFPFKKSFHIIFCRNVMIYFDQPTRDALVKRFHQSTEPGGYLFIGHSETLGRNQSLYRYLMPAAYQKGTL
ncbi:protein-glutamate O-methyltransferase CheR [Desulfuromonas sp. AOP6]|uniref:CheR family methyltransferase n=1 Tax=Desulfuromonas sp. AOP6 TaxID=1566351 RepID=UPI00126DF823|nr:protein-glutamate O-methyltransferase CheR [Desulfuromonas sp. AOP6]BCA79100.1 chemotaxis protein methyltransferase [Desulfuromonas sp. AOP6]